MLLRLAGQSDKSNDQEAENMSYFTFHSKKIFYKEAGHGKPLVMLHGDTGPFEEAIKAAGGRLDLL